MVSTYEQMHVPNWTGPDVWMSKRPLLAAPVENLPKSGYKVKIGNKVQPGNKFTKW